MTEYHPKGVPTPDGDVRHCDVCQSAPAVYDWLQDGEYPEEDWLAVCAKCFEAKKNDRD